MNKSIFVGDTLQVNRVYSKKTKEILKIEAGLNIDEVFAKQNLLDNPEISKNTEYIFSTWGMNKFSEDQIEKVFPNLKAVFYAAGTVQGFAREFLNKGIKVFSAWAANAVPVSEYTLSQIILANKGFYQGLRLYTEKKNVTLGREHCYRYPGNYGCKVGLIGIGMIGSMVANLLKQFNLQVLAYDPFLSDERAKELNVKKVSLEEMFSECTTISNHLANNPQTVGLLNYSLFSKMGDCTTFINTGRGAQLIEADLIRALQENPTISAVLDVTMPEPPLENSLLYNMPNVFLTPHIAGSFGDEVFRLSEYMRDEYRRLKNDENNLYEVTLEKLATMA